MIPKQCETVIVITGPNTHTSMKAGQYYYTADQLRTYGDQRAAEAREQMREECEIAINPHASYLGDEVIDIIKELK